MLAPKLFEHLRYYMNDMLRFWVAFPVPFDDNAERDSRMRQVRLKVSGG